MNANQTQTAQNVNVREVSGRIKTDILDLGLTPMEADFFGATYELTKEDGTSVELIVDIDGETVLVTRKEFNKNEVEVFSKTVDASTAAGRVELAHIVK